MATIRPLRRSIMCGRTARIELKTPVRFTSIVRRHWTSSMSTMSLRE
jgi:hypothetical protein